MNQIKWINEPPIIPVGEQEFAILCKEFGRTIKMGWRLIRAPTSCDDEQMAWNARVDDSKLITDIGRRGRSERHYAYVVAGRPIGLMAICGLAKKEPYIDILVTHPGSMQCGGILIEYAVELSEDAGCGGSITLYAMSRSALAYLALGFVMTNPDPFGEGGMMKLDPAKSNEKWAWVGGRWRLRKYLETKTFAA